MKRSTPLPSTITSRTGRFLLAALQVGFVLAAGCANQPSPQSSAASNPALRPIQSPPGGNAADIDRATLARFIGDWTFEGWADENGIRHNAQGRAAAAMEKEHFVLIEVQAGSGQLGGRALRNRGSMLLAAEPDLGLTLTTWGDASPSIGRLVGKATAGGSSFTFTELQTPPGRHRVSLSFTFQTDNRFIAEVRDISAEGSPVISEYKFTRAAP